MSSTEWPAGKTFGELTPAQKRAAISRTVARMQEELQAAAPEIEAILNLPEHSSVPDQVRNVGPVVASVKMHAGMWTVVAQRDDAPFGPDRAYSTHVVEVDPELGEWVATGSGHYDLTWAEALKLMMGGRGR